MMLLLLVAALSLSFSVVATSTTQRSPLRTSSYVHVPSQLQEDPLSPLFSFDAGSDTSAATSSHSSASTHAYVTAFASFVMRVPRRVTSVGMWQPGPDMPSGTIEHSDEAQAAAALAHPPPDVAPVVSTSTLNLLVTTTFLRRSDSIERALHFSLLPGPSFAPGSMAAHSEKFGAAATGFEPALFSMIDRREVVVGYTGTDAIPQQGEENLLFTPESFAVTDEPRLPGYGSIQTLRSMAGQNSESWLIYSSGVYIGGRVRSNVALYSLLVTGWYDVALARAQRQAFDQATAAARLSHSPPPPPMSLNGIGLRLRIHTDFAIQPFERGVALLGSRVSAASHPMHMNQREAELVYGAGVSMSAEGMVETDDSDMELVPYAQIVDFYMYQQKRLIFIGVAYDDGFIRSVRND
jgi:hypothetical protein